MALAKYFAKDALAISQILNKGSVEQFENILNKHIVEIAFDESVRQGEGQASLDMLVRLLARLYPKLKLTDISGTNQDVLMRLAHLAQSINGNIDITEGESTAALVVGSTHLDTGPVSKPVFYIGSEGWVAKFSTFSPVGSGTSLMPFAAGAAACLGAANLFRFVFQELMGDMDLDQEVLLSLLNLELGDLQEVVTTADFGEVTMVGLGAIGSGAIWALSYLKKTKGIINLVDDQALTLSNLQRYVITEEQDEGRDKVDIAHRVLQGTAFEVKPFPYSWKEYRSRIGHHKQPVLLTALDSARDRIAVQSSLPKCVINGYTEQGLLGVSRHFSFLDKPCLCCLYMPTGEKKSKSMEIAENLGIPEHEQQVVRRYLYYNSPVDESLLDLIATANSIAKEELTPFLGQPINAFYANFVCGGVMLQLTNGEGKKISMEAPLAFQSALAGILMASELFLYRSNYRTTDFPVMTHFYPVLPFNAVSNPYNHGLSKDETGRCICADVDFRNVYQNKWITGLQQVH